MILEHGLTRQRELQVLLVILAVGAVFRFVSPGADVPWEATANVFSPLEDAFWYLESAAGGVEGSPADEQTKWSVPVWSHVARTWFRVFGVSWGSAHALAGLVSLLTVLCLWKLVRSALGPVAALSAAGVLAVLYPYVGLSRTTLIYGPATLALLTGAALFLCGRGRPASQRWALELSAWVLVLGTVVAIRPPAAALSGGLLLGHLVRARRPLLLVVVLGGGGLGLAGAVLAIHQLTPIGFVDDTLYRISLQAGGGQSGPLEWIWRLLRVLGERSYYGEREVLVAGAPPFLYCGSGYLPLAPGALAVGGLGLLLAGWNWSLLTPAARETLAVLGGWWLCFLLGAWLLDNRPLRYFLLIGPPLAAFAGFAVACAARIGSRPPPRYASDRLVAAWCCWGALVGGFAAAHALDHVSGPLELASLWKLVLAALGGGFLMALCAVLRTAWRPSPALRAPLTLVLVGAATCFSATRSLQLVADPSWRTRDANRAVAELEGPVFLAGPYASVLALGNGQARILGWWMNTSDPYIEGTIERLRTLGVTHLAVGEGQARSALLAPRFAAAGVELELIVVLEIGAPPRRRGDPTAWVYLYRLPWASPG